MAFSDLVAAMDRVAHDVVGGVSVVYAPSVGSAVSVTGMFDEEYIDAESGRGRVGTVTPSIVVRLEDLPDDPRLARPTLTREGVGYKLKGWSTDGVEGGSIRLILRRSTS